MANAAVRAAIAPADWRMEPLPPYLSIEKAMQVMSCCEKQVYILMGDKQFRAIKMGRKILVDTASLLAYLSSLPEAEIAPTRRKVGG